MTGPLLLFWGLGLGFRHALDADHVVAVTGLLQREPSTLRAARIAASWGAGHSLTFWGLGVIWVLWEVRLPHSFEQAADTLVAMMLLGLGLRQLWRLFRPTPTPQSAKDSNWRSVGMGLVHGLAGSAGVALLATATVPNKVHALLYLLAVGLGTLLGMMAVTVLLSWPLRWGTAMNPSTQRAVHAFAALITVTLGASMLVLR